MPDPLDLVELPFARTALAELLLLAVAGGLLGGWIVLRRLAFFSHAVGSVTFPGLVVAGAAGLAAPLAALAVALGYTGGVAAIGRGGRRREPPGQADGAELPTALLLVAALAVGIVLASDVFSSGAEVDTLLFGTLIGLDGTDVALAGGAAALAAMGTLSLGRTWVAAGFDRESAPAGGRRASVADALLPILIALAVVAALPAVGALLTTALFIVPAATVRLFARSVPALLGGGAALAACEGVVSLYLALWLDAPPGPALALLGGLVYAGAALARAVLDRSARSAAGIAVA